MKLSSPKRQSQQEQQQTLVRTANHNNTETQRGPGAATGQPWQATAEPLIDCKTQKYGDTCVIVVSNAIGTCMSDMSVTDMSVNDTCVSDICVLYL